MYSSWNVSGDSWSFEGILPHCYWIVLFQAAPENCGPVVHALAVRLYFIWQSSQNQWFQCHRSFIGKSPLSPFNVDSGGRLFVLYFIAGRLSSPLLMDSALSVSRRFLFWIVLSLECFIPSLCLLWVIPYPFVEADAYPVLMLKLRGQEEGSILYSPANRQPPSGVHHCNIKPMPVCKAEQTEAHHHESEQAQDLT